MDQTSEQAANLILANQIPKYRIGTVSRLTGLSADVVRVWERRYRAIQPGRSEGGSRLYSDAEIERLRRLRQAVEMGHAIGQVAKLPDGELEQLASNFKAAHSRQSTDPHTVLQENFLQAISRFDIAAADLEISRAATLYPPRVLVQNIIAPLLQEIGLRWAHQEIGIAHERIATNLIRTVLSSLFRLYPPDSTAESIVLATPQGERHEFGILLAALFAASRGWRVVYLGTDLPAAEISRTVKLTNAKVLALSLVYQPNQETERELVLLAHHLAAQDFNNPPQVWLGGAQAMRYQHIAELSEWVLLKDLGDYDERLQHPFISNNTISESLMN